MTREAPDLDLGHGHTLSFVAWAPDRDLNPQYADLPDLDRYGARVGHLAPDGTECPGGYVTFVSLVADRVDAGRPKWVVHSWEPLTLSPSLLCRYCGDHGFVSDGEWVPA